MTGVRRPHIGLALLQAAQEAGGVEDLPVPERDDTARAVEALDWAVWLGAAWALTGVRPGEPSRMKYVSHVGQVSEEPFVVRVPASRQPPVIPSAATYR